MAITFISGICPSVNVYAATRDISTNEEKSLLENQSPKDKVKENKENKDKSKKDNLENDKLSTKETQEDNLIEDNETQEDNLEEDTDETLDEEDKKPSPGWHVINGKRFYFTEDGMLQKTGWFEIEEYIVKGTEYNPQVYQPSLKKKEDVKTKKIKIKIRRRLNQI
nr:hypothetical protein [Clostridium taeniosporum]